MLIRQWRDSDGLAPIKTDERGVHELFNLHHGRQCVYVPPRALPDFGARRRRQYDFPMPFFDQSATPATPGRAPYKNEVVQKWTAAIAQTDGFIFVTPEYNYGTSAVLKNAIDWVYPEWNRKAAGFVSYGSAMGARAVQQLRESAIEVQLAPIRSSVHIPVATLWAHYTGGDVDAGLAELEAPAGAMIDDLLWWTAALKAAR